MNDILNKMIHYAVIGKTSDIWRSEEPVIYPNYTPEDIEDFFKMVDENDIFSMGRDSIKKFMIEKPTDRHCMTTTLSMPIEMVSDELKRIEENQNNRKDGFKFWTECICLEIFKWRLKRDK